MEGELLEFSTQFAPAARLSRDGVLGQAQTVGSSAAAHLFSIMPYVMLVLNKYRQVIYSNRRLLEILGIPSGDELLGLRPGELFKCIHSERLEGGCGTTEYCSVCGAVLAILESQKTKSKVEKECLITVSGEKGPMSMELMVHAVPAVGVDEEYILFTIRDISVEKRKRAIEQVFFHDLLNTSGALKGLVEIMKGTGNPEELKELSACVDETAAVLLDEIKNQKDLLAAEHGELAVTPALFSVREVLEKLIGVYERDDTNRNSFCLTCPMDLVLSSDVVLVRRMMNNMLKNAVEASEAGLILVSALRKGSFVELSVSNGQWIPRDIQLQIFKRSFSTKGEGRGLGTYGMKLIGEKYLGGYVRFFSRKKTGTTFFLGLPDLPEPGLLS